MKKVVIAVACLASFLVAKECATMADLINGCIKTEYNYDKKPIKQSEWKNKKEVRVIYTKEYHNNGNLASDCSGNVCKYYDKNGEFVIEYRDNKPYNGFFLKTDFTNNIVSAGEYKNGLKDGEWLEEYPMPNNSEAKLFCTYVNGVKNGEAQIWNGDTTMVKVLKGRGQALDEKMVNENAGFLVESGQYINEKKNGIWKKYSFGGKLEFEGEYKDGKLIKIIRDNKAYQYAGNEENIDLSSIKKP